MQKSVREGNGSRTESIFQIEYNGRAKNSHHPGCSLPLQVSNTTLYTRKEQKIWKHITVVYATLYNENCVIF